MYKISHEMIALSVFFAIFVIAEAGPATEAAYKGQYCTDPRTMRKHAAYTEWADAYSCTRHRCQPGGRNLAIYTVGCKRVEAPESAIECEEVVEDTNMQFPYCCTRLRCLVVVRGEVWTRVLGQPWETLPAAPWSHMYKMKKPPPGAEGTFLPKSMVEEVPARSTKYDAKPIDALEEKLGEGPVYELQTEAENSDSNPDKVLRTSKKSTAIAGPECSDVAVVRAAPPPPDIVIALSTNDKEAQQLSQKKEEGPRYTPMIMHKRVRTNDAISKQNNNFFEDEAIEPRAEDLEEPVTEKEKPIEPTSEERFYSNSYTATQKPKAQHHQQVAWTEIPQSQWNEHDPPVDAETVPPKDASQEIQRTFHQPDYPAPIEEKKEEKPGNLQALVDAIGTRMRDIENVVQRMSEKVHQAKTTAPEGDVAGSMEKASADGLTGDRRHHEGKDKDHGKMKKANPEGEHYKRGSKYLRSGAETTTEQPLFIEDTNLNGYFSDASNSLVRRSPPKEPAATYMAPIGDNRRKSRPESEEQEKKHKKHSHKKKRAKGHHKKHHGKEDKRRKFRLNSVELDKNAVSLEDSSAIASQ